jgi:midasin
LSRILAAVVANTPLLIEGPPGIGKTVGIQDACALLNVPYERINFSSATSPEHLFGSIVPKVTKHGRVFEWQDGKLVAALKARSFIIFDEINLCPPEVLETLVPLLTRGSQRFCIPGTDSFVSLEGVRFFGTMNPRTGGSSASRSQLPRSVLSRFTCVALEAYDAVDMTLLMRRVFLKLVQDGMLRESDLDSIFALHCAVQDAVRVRKIGKVGGPFDFNLRDITKLHSVLDGNARDLIDHLKFFGTSEDSGNLAASGSSADDVAPSLSPYVLAVRKFAQLVYGACFPRAEDQLFVQSLVDVHLPLPEGLGVTNAAEDASIDDTVPGYLRIGTVYLRTGHCPDIEVPQSFIHSRVTVDQLSLLAAAVQSKRPVLLQGDCCGKTSLVRELARLARRKLVIIHMSDSVEASDLVGQWLPEVACSAGVTLLSMLSRWRSVVDEASKLLLLLVIPMLKESTDISSVSACLQFVVNAVGDVSSASPLDSVSALAAVMEVLKVNLEQILTYPLITSSIDNEASVMAKCSGMAQRLGLHYAAVVKARDSIARTPSPAEPGANVAPGDEPHTGFVFVEAPLVSAIKSGDWVLLDNANSAPPETLERLNSLFEKDRVLNVFESGEGVVYRDGACADDSEPGVAPVHEDFRIFATANPRRVNTHSLSAAFLNRMVSSPNPAPSPFIRPCAHLGLCCAPAAVPCSTFVPVRFESTCQSLTIESP